MCWESEGCRAIFLYHIHTSLWSHIDTSYCRYQSCTQWASMLNMLRVDISYCLHHGRHRFFLFEFTKPLDAWMPRTLSRGNWYFCNDATVAKCSIDDALKAETYVAFYRKIEDGDWSLKMMHATAPSGCRINGQVTQTQLPDDAPLIWSAQLLR